MATEDTVLGTAVDHRWDAHEDDYTTYSYIFEQAYSMTQSESDLDRATGALVFSIINAWEKNGRAIPMPVISSTYTLAMEYQEYDKVPEGIIHLDFDPETE